MTDLIIAESTQLDRPLVGEFTPVSWIAPEDMTWEEWIFNGESLSLATGAMHFWIGDWILAGEYRWGEKYAQAVDQTKFVIGTLQNDAWVCSRVPISLRNEQLSYTHHVIVADRRFDAGTQKTLLDRAELRGWTTRYMRKVIQNWYYIFGGHTRPSHAVSRSRDISVSALPSSTDLASFILDAPRRQTINWRGFFKREWKLKRHWKRRAIAAEERVEQLQNEIADMTQVYSEESLVYSQAQEGDNWGFRDE